MPDEPLVCDDCGKAKPDVKEGFCPYNDDVNNNPNVPATLCGDCRHERCMDI